MSSSSSRAPRGRLTADRLAHLANHLTDRDREIALALYEHRILTSSQLTLLFFSGRRRAMDRLLFLYRRRVLDRFYPPRPFAYGKPQAHWLLDEAGAHIVAACLGFDRKQLGWKPRENWGTHPQLAHRLETNTFITDLVAATLPHPALGVAEWWGSGSVKDQMPEGVGLVPDGRFMFATSAGVVDCLLEWDRGTEPGSVLEHKLRMYRKAAGRTHDRCCVLFIVPGTRRVSTLAEAAERATGMQVYGDAWPVLVATVPELREFGPFGAIWQPLGDHRRAAQRIDSLPTFDLESLDAADALGRRWRKDQPRFWHALSPLGTPAPDEEERR
jgi:hypothetical protein